MLLDNADVQLLLLGIIKLSNLGNERIEVEQSLARDDVVVLFSRAGMWTCCLGFGCR